MRPAKIVWDEALRAYVMSDNSITDAPGYAAATAVIEADRAELVAEIVAWLNRRAGHVLQLHAEAKTDHERNIVDEHASALEQSAIEIEAKWGVKK